MNSGDMGYYPAKLSGSTFAALTERLLAIRPMRLAQDRTETELLLMGASLTAGLIMFLEGLIPGAFGLLAGGIAASEIFLRRASAASGVAIIAAIAVSFAFTPNQSSLILGLVDIAAIIFPLHRRYIPALLLSQTLLLTYVLSYVGWAAARNASLSWWQLLVNVIVFNVIVGVGNDLASRRRKLETNLDQEIRQSRVLTNALKREEILRRGLMAIRDEVDQDRVLRRLVASAQELLRADVVQILLPEGAAARSRANPDARSSLSPMSRLRTGQSRSVLLQTVVETRQPVWLTEWHQEPIIDKWLRMPIRARSLALIPIIVSGNVYGVVGVAWRIPREIPLSDQAVVLALVEQAGVALERVIVREELAARAEGAEALHQVSARLAGRRDIHKIAEQALSALRSLYHADAAVFYLRRHEDEVEAFAAQGLPPDDFSRLHAEYAGDRRGVLLRSGRSMVISAGSDDRRCRTRELLADLAIQSLIDVPAVWEERTMGGLVLYHRHNRGYTQYEIQLLETFAQQLAGGMELAKAYREIETFDRQREKFLALMSHELRQPVAGIAAMAEALAMTPGLGPAESRALEGMRQQARHLAALAEEVLSIAQLESGHFSLRPTTFDLCALVAGISDQSPDPSRIQVQLPSGHVFMEGDPERIGQALGNVIGNALKYSEADLPVKVNLTATDYWATIQVQDYGVGIDPDQIPVLFRKYSRLPNRRSDVVKGSGLGLYLTRLLVEAHGGTVSAASPGKDLGATFTVTLPLQQHAGNNGTRDQQDSRWAQRVR